MSTSRPWEIGDSEARWVGYFITPDSKVLRNKLGIEDQRALTDAENDLLEIRLAELRERPNLVQRTYDLSHLQALHRHLFQDVYEWAGELRTVGIAKGGGESFVPPLNIELPVKHAVQRIRESDFLRSLRTEDVPREIAYLYDYLNFAHPFREGNGRTQREFFSQLLSVAAFDLDWMLIERAQLYDACHIARNEGDLVPMTQLFETILVRAARG